MADGSPASQSIVTGHEPTPVVLGVSLKLYMDVPRTLEWTRALVETAAARPEIAAGRVELFVLPSLPALPAVADILRGTPIAWGGQDLHWEDRGAYTGATSGADLRGLGSSFVEIGHAERRRYFGEEGKVVAKKLLAAQRNALTPVLCAGERTRASLDEAVAETLAQIDDALALAQPGEGRLVVAYEPEWAIGSAEAAPVEHIDAVVGAIRAHLAGDARFARLDVIYGGSAGRGTLSSLGLDASGLFLGRFAHDPEQLAAIIDEALAR